MRRAMMFCVIMGMLGLLTGCKGDIRRDVSLSMNPADYNGSVPPTRVHVVGVQQVELEKYKSYPVDQWFKADDMLRQGSKERVMELMFGGTQPNTQTIPKDEAMWKIWKERECLYLVVFVNLPASAQQAGSVNDPRKLDIPLKRVKSPVELRVLRSGIQFAVPPKPED